MWFVDQAEITVKAGAGGRGCTAYAQPPYTRAPYPDGGNGGDGGDVIIRTDPHLTSLLDFHFRHTFHAGRGAHGGGNNRTGGRGNDCVIRVPPGTVIRDVERAALLRDLTEPDEAVVAATGGRGGLGNANRAVRRSRRMGGARRGRRGAGPAALGEATPGAPGEERRLLLELKLIADVGLIGFPNAGKSSLLARISTARPKIGAYPFTTLSPVLGVVEAGEDRVFTACDIPGLIEGAHQGKGLGMQFLRHIERTRLLVHVIDVAAVDGRDPVEAFRQLNAELAAYGQELVTKPQVVVGNKLDLPEARARLPGLEEAVGRRVWPISCATGAGLRELVAELARQLSTR